MYCKHMTMLTGVRRWELEDGRRAACATPTTFGGANDMCRAYAANALPAMTCDEGLSAQQWQENAKALRAAQGIAPPYVFHDSAHSR